MLQDLPFKNTCRSFGIRRCLCLLLVCGFFLYSITVPATADNAALTPVDESEYFGRQALSTLPNATGLLYAYDSLADGVESCSDSVDLERAHITLDELQTALYAYLCDYPQHFWLGKSYSYSLRGNYINSMTPSYLFSGSALTAAKTAFNQAAEELLTGLTDDMSELTREKILHDRLAEKITYDFTDNAHNAYGGMVENTAVCEGYAKAFQYLLYQAGISNFLVTGTGTPAGSSTPEAHAWNLVRIDGDYYYVDLTWDDQPVDTFYAYFNITEQQLLEDHILDTYAYSYPACTATKANYFTVYGGRMNTYSSETVIRLLSSNQLRAHIYLTGETDSFWTDCFADLSNIAKGVNIVGSSSMSGYSLNRERLVILTGQRRGDLNQDNAVDTADLSLLAGHLCGESAITDSLLLKAADINQDDTVNLRDHQRLYEHCSGVAPIGASQTTKPPVPSADATLSIQPNRTTVPSSDSHAEVTFTLTVTPPAEGSIGYCQYRLSLPAGVTLKSATVNPSLPEGSSTAFSLAAFNNMTFFLSGSNPASHQAITEETELMSITVSITEPTPGDSYALQVEDGLCGAESTVSYNLVYTSQPVTVTESSAVSSQPVSSEEPASTLPSSVPSEVPSSAPASSLPEPSDVPSQPSSVPSEPSSSSPVASLPEPSDVPSQPEPADSSVASSPAEELTLGDLNADTVINAADALLVLKAAVGKITLTQEQMAIADMNRDGKIDAADALRILKIAVGKDS